jgi:hypothetical protein
VTAESTRPRPTNTGTIVVSFDGTDEQAQPPPSIEKASGSGSHFLFVGLQMGSAGGQSTLDSHWTQFFVCGSQMGTEPGHSELFEQVFPHVWVVVSQIGFAGVQSVFELHWTQFFVCGSQTGVSPGHSALLEHVLPQVCVSPLQIGFDGSLQSAFVTHSTHVLVLPSQSGIVDGHCLSSVQVATHVLVCALHTGVSAGQSADVLHCTQAVAGTSHTGVGETHAVVFVAVHWTQKPSGSLHAGSGAEQFASLVQPTVQTWVTVLHLPFAPVHCESFTHSTQVDVATSQTGVPSVHAVAFVASHCTQLPAKLPEPRHAGLATVGHVALPFAPRSPSHATQVPAALQIGLLPEHCALLEHCTHMCVVELHAGVAPLHSSRSVLVQGTHLPASAPAFTHAGLAADAHAWAVPELRSPSHATQLPPEQIGVAPEQLLLSRHWTHALVVRLHLGAPPLHCASERQATQTLVAVLQCAVGSAQFASSVQPSVHVCAAVLHTPLAPVQSVLLLHWTHWFVVVLQAGSPPGQADVFVALHATQAPATQAGMSLCLQANVAPLLKSPLHATQVSVAVLQIGLVPTHAPGYCDVHSAHFLTAVSQTLLAPLHWPLFTHSTHAWVVGSQAGAADVGQAALLAVPKSPLQPTQTPPELQTGVVPPQSAADRHETQVCEAPQYGVAPPH